MYKKILLIPILTMALHAAHAQEDAWTTATNYNPTDNCLDSTTCFTDVVVDVNLETVPDSATIHVKVGTSYGVGDIYTKSYLICDSMYLSEGIIRSGEYVATIPAGSYVLSDKLHIAVSIE